MGGKLLIVESPAKVRTIRRYLGREFVVKASVGHVVDLPRSRIGVNVDAGFKPEYDVIQGKDKVLDEIVKAARSAQAVYLAPDPDREGEAIAYHIKRAIGPIGVPVHRVLFHEITRGGIVRGLEAPRAVDERKFESQQARRILDRLVGYELSPILWRKIQRGLSAGRVQSVALRLVVERELAIRAFVPEEYWHLFATVAPEAAAPAGAFRAQLVRIDGEPAKVRSADEAAAVKGELERARLRVAKVDERQRRRNPLPPYVTSRLQQDASSKFHFTAKRTMSAAQQLYEGVDVGNGGPTGLITYMRTDSTRVSDVAVASCRDFVAATYGASEVPARPNVFRSRAGAQDAHEAIRPTDVTIVPEKVAALLTPDQARIYGLVWRRFVACQMKPAVYAVTSVDVDAVPPAAGGRTLSASIRKYDDVSRSSQAPDGAPSALSPEPASSSPNLRVEGLSLRATCSRLVERGWLAVFDPVDGAADPAPTSDSANGEKPAGGERAPAKGAAEQQVPADEGCAATALPPLANGEALVLVPPGTAADRKFTQPPPRFTEGSLVREMEELGIGRPSTYAATMSTLVERRYVRKEEQKLVPTELGEMVSERLTKHFPDVMSADFTARMETELDRVEEGTIDWRRLLADFYVPFHADIERAMKEMSSVKGEMRPTDEKCERCGAPMVSRWGRAGRFLACTKYPECTFTRDAGGPDSLSGGAPLPDVSGEVCATCGKPMQIRRGRFGAFLACTGYPACKSTRPLPTGVKCPREGCGGALVDRRTKKGRTFWGCSNHSKTGCDFALWRRPVPRKCPQCGASFLVEAKSRAGVTLLCAGDSCGYKAGPAGVGAEESA